MTSESKRTTPNPGTAVGPAPETAASRRTLLRDAGLRATAARLAVLDVLISAGAPLSHGEVVRALAGRAVDRATVYRNLIDLADAGLATRGDLGDHVWRFAAAGAGHGQARHPHFVCRGCGRVQCLPDTRVRVAAGNDAPEALRGDEVEIQIRGLCDDCQ